MMRSGLRPVPRDSEEGRGLGQELEQQRQHGNEWNTAEGQHPPESERGQEGEGDQCGEDPADSVSGEHQGVIEVAPVRL